MLYAGWEGLRLWSTRCSIDEADFEDEERCTYLRRVFVSHVCVCCCFVPRDFSAVDGAVYLPRRETRLLVVGGKATKQFFARSVSFPVGVVKH